MTDAVPKSIEDQFNALQTLSSDQQKKISDETEKGKQYDAEKSVLEPVAKRKEVSAKSFATKRRDLEREWDCQKIELDKITAEIVGKFPDYVQLINDKICPVLEKITTQQGVIDKFAAHKGSKEKIAADKKLAAEASKIELDAWFDAEANIKKRLEKIEDLIKTLRTVMAGPDDVFGIYLLWFKILPLHQEIAPPHAPPAPCAPEAAGPDAPPVQKPRCLPVPDPKAVYLISVADYGPKLDEAWANYQAARKAQSEAEKDFKEHADDLAAEIKTLKTKTDAQDDDVKNALKA